MSFLGLGGKQAGGGDDLMERINRMRNYYRAFLEERLAYLASGSMPGTRSISALPADLMGDEDESEEAW